MKFKIKKIIILISTASTSLISTATSSIITTTTGSTATNLTTTPLTTSLITTNTNTSTTNTNANLIVNTTPATTSSTTESQGLITSGLISNTPSTSTSSVITPNQPQEEKNNILNANLDSQEINKNAPVISLKIGENYTFKAPENSEILPDEDMLNKKKTTQKLDSVAISSSLKTVNNQKELTVKGVRESKADEEPYPIIVKKDEKLTTIARVRVVQK